CRLGVRSGGPARWTTLCPCAAGQWYSTRTPASSDHRLVRRRIRGSKLRGKRRDAIEFRKQSPDTALRCPHLFWRQSPRLSRRNRGSCLSDFSRNRICSPAICVCILPVAYVGKAAVATSRPSALRRRHEPHCDLQREHTMRKDVYAAIDLDRRSGHALCPSRSTSMRRTGRQTDSRNDWRVAECLSANDHARCALSFLCACRIPRRLASRDYQI